MDIGAITAAVNVPTPAAPPLPATATRDFSALVLESMLRHAGLTLVGTGADAASGGLVNDLVIQMLAQQLAVDFDVAGTPTGAQTSIARYGR